MYDLETQIPTFFHITSAKAHDSRAMDAIPYEENSFYIFDRGYNDFQNLHNIHSVNAYFVVRGKKNNSFKPMKWKRRLKPESGILSDATRYILQKKMAVDKTIYEILQNHKYLTYRHFQP